MSISKPRRTALLACVSAIAICAAGAASAQEVIDGGAHEIVDGAGLGAGAPPATRGSPWNVGGDLTVGDLTTGFLTVRNGGVVLSDWGHIGNASGSAGDVTVTGAGSSWGLSSILRVGGLGSGALTIADGGEVSGSGAFIADGAGSSGVVTVTGTGSTWDNSFASVLVGGSGSGVLTIEAGGAVSNTVGYVGANAGSTGEVTVTGAGSIWTNSGDLNVGNSGTGTLTIADGGDVTNTTGYIGATAGSTGGVAVTGAGSIWTNSSGLYVGHAGTGALTIEAGGAVSNTVGLIGNLAGSAGDVTVTGAGSIWTNAGGLYVGNSGTGTLTIADGGDVTNTTGYIGLPAGSTGGVTVTGAGSAWTNSSDLRVGHHGTGALTIEAGGAVSNTVGYIGVLSGSTGDVTVTGAGSVWTNSADLRVGNNGAGTLSIADGGAVTNITSQIGVFTGSTGDATVTGAGSLWAVSGDLMVGQSGSGTLEIADGGVVRVGGGSGLVHVGQYTGSTGVLNIGAAAGDAAVAAGTLEAAEVRFGLGSSTLVFNHTDDDYIFAPLITGAGALNHHAGTTILTADNTWTGVTTVHGGTLVIEGASNQGVSTYRVGQLAGDDGTLIIRDGGTVTAGLGLLGEASGATGAATVTGAGSGWTSEELSVGYYGSGVLLVEAGGAVTNTTSQIGVFTGSTGDATVTGAGSLWAVSGELMVGRAGLGALEIAAGGQVTTGSGVIGYFAGSAGDVTVTGAGSIWTNSSDLMVGNFGTGTLTIVDAGAVSSQSGFIGHVAGSAGEVTVTGAGSIWTNSGNLYVGLAGSGALTIADGGVVTNTSGFIGAAVGSTGAVTVTGANSLWANSGEFFVAQNGSGALSISGGGQVTSGTGYIGYDVGSTGAATVTGANSLWAAASSLLVGRSGAGALVIADGGLVRAGGGTGVVEVGRDGSASGVLSIGAAAGDAAVAAGTLEAAEVRFGSGTGSLVFNHTNTAYDFDAFITGAGQIDVLSGLTTLTGDSSAFTGATAVSGGDLRVAGTLGGDVTVSGGSLGGSGSVLGAVSVGAGTLAGVQGQLLTLGSLDLAAGSTVEVALGAASSDALFDVTSDLVLDGTLNVTDAGGFGAGVYGLFTYGGVLTDNGLVVGATPTGVTAGDLVIQTSVAGQVNLVSAAGQDLLFWDGGNAALHDNGAVNGGAGTWTSGGQSWTGANGLVTSAMRPDPGFAIFMATAGTVTVSGPDVGVTGMQFAVDGYLVEGDAVELTEAETIVRVGDGTLAGAGITAVIASALTGSGQLVKTDLGTLILTGANSYTGGVEVRDGTLVGDADSLVGDILNDATLVFDQATDASYTGAISGDGEAFKAGAGTLTLTGANAMDWTVQTGGLTVGGAAFAGDVTVEAGAMFSFDPAADAVWGGVLSGSGDFQKLGGSTLTLTGDSSAFDGTTTISGGSLMVNGALGGELVIAADGFLGGSGAIGQLTIADGAIVSPGNSIGTLNVNGDLVIAAGSIYEVEVDPTGTASDLIAVTGTATLNGGTVQHIGLTGDYAPSSTYTILTAAGGVTGTFDAVATDFAFLDATLGYTAQAVTLTLDRNNISFAGVGETLNQQSTGDAIETGGWGTPLYGAVIGLSADNARLAFAQLSGELHGSLRSALVEDSGQVRGLLGQRMRQSDADQRGLRMWAQAHGAVGHMGTDGNAASLRSRSGGLWLGAEGALAPGLILGVAAGAERSTHNSARSGEAERDGYRLAAYGAGQWGAFGLSGGVAAAQDDIETDRTAIFPGFAQQLEADYSAETIQAFAEATWTIPAGAGVIEPFASVARVRTETDGFTETGGTGALTVQDQTQEVTFATLGLGARRGFDDGHGRTGNLGGRLGWRHASGDLASSTNQAFAAGAAFTVNGLPVDEDALVAEIGGELSLGEALALKVDWTGQAGEHTAQRLSATLSWRF